MNSDFRSWISAYPSAACLQQLNLTCFKFFCFSKMSMMLIWTFFAIEGTFHDFSLGTPFKQRCKNFNVLGSINLERFQLSEPLFPPRDFHTNHRFSVERVLGAYETNSFMMASVTSSSERFLSCGARYKIAFNPSTAPTGFTHNVFSEKLWKFSRHGHHHHPRAIIRIPDNL